MSTGEKVPIVFFPRFTTISGVTEFNTTPIDMLGFSSYEVQTWRGETSVPGSSTLDLKIRMEESADLITWSTLQGSETTVGTSPSAIAQTTPTMRYVRAVAYLDNWTGGETAGSVTFWAVGYAIKTVM